MDSSMKTIKFQMFAVLLMTTAVWVSGQADNTDTSLKGRDLCPPGYFLSSTGFWLNETRCEPCPNGTYEHRHNLQLTCTPLRTCTKPREILVSEGNSTVDTVCQCEKGTERTYRGKIGELQYNCTPCPPGTVSKLLIDFYPYLPGDTICCPPEHIARKTFLQRECVHPNNDSPPTTVASSSTENVSDKPPKNYHPEAAGIIVGIFLAGLTILACIILYGITHPRSFLAKCVPECLWPAYIGPVTYTPTHNGHAIV